MDSAYLLVIDDSPDHAQVLNSFLRNAGVAVRVVNATSFLELETALKEKLDSLESNRLARECAKLDPDFEKSLAEEGLSEDLSEWPEY